MGQLLLPQGRLRTNRSFIVETASDVAGVADVQPSGFINQFFVAGRFGGQGGAILLMKCIREVARQRKT
jgi:putative acetyltransferase